MEGGAARPRAVPKKAVGRRDQIRASDPHSSTSEDVEDLDVSLEAAQSLAVARSSSLHASTYASATSVSTSDRQQAAASGVPGSASVWVKTFGCSHNVSDGEYMAGLLDAAGYAVSHSDSCASSADVWVVNSCTVKDPSQGSFETLVQRGQGQGKTVIVSGCVPQGERARGKTWESGGAMENVSVVGVQQLSRVVEVVESALRGETMRLMGRKTLPELDIPKVRRNPRVEIIPINVGCLGSCTYCKTVHARGALGSYTLDALESRLVSAVADGAVEVWLTSEDTGAYGIDLGTDIAVLLKRLVSRLPMDGSVMLRLGMTNPPYILKHLDSVAQCLRHPAVYAHLHVPVQSAADTVLERMNREYTVADFRQVADSLLSSVPGLHLATDIIAGFPGETDAEWDATVDLVDTYRFPAVHISQFYPRPGTPAASMKPRVGSKTARARTRQMAHLFESYVQDALIPLVGTVQRCLVTDRASDGVKLVAHTKTYVQVLLTPRDEDHERRLMGASVMVYIARSAGKWSVLGEVLDGIEAEEAAAKWEQDHAPSAEDVATWAEWRQDANRADGEAIAAAKEERGESKPTFSTPQFCKMDRYFDGWDALAVAVVVVAASTLIALRWRL